MTGPAPPRRPHRRAPRPLANALAALSARVEPATPLARIQREWPGLACVLPAAHESSPTNLRDGVLTVGCAASVWAQELQLSAEDAIAYLNGQLGENAVRELRAHTTGSG